MHHAAGHEGRFQVFAQGLDDVARRERGCHHEGHRAHDAFGHVVWQPKGAVVYTRDAVEVEVQVCQRTALAGHVDEVVGAAQQLEVGGVSLGVLQHQHVGQRRGFHHVTASDDEALTGPTRIRTRVRTHFCRNAQFAQRLPRLAGRGAAAGHLACLGAAVDFHQLAVKRRFGLRGQLRRQGRRGRQRQRHTRQRQTGQHQRLQVEGRGDQRARLGHAAERVHDVGRVERPAGVETGAAQQGQQHRALKAVAVLRGHGGHQGQALQRRLLQVFSQALGFGPDVAHQRAPALGMGLRCTGAAAGEQADGFQVHRNLRHGGGRHGPWQPLHTVRAQAACGGWFVVDQQVGRAALGRNLGQCLRQRVRWHQAGLAADQRGGQAQREVHAVLAQVDGAAFGQGGGQCLRFGDELAGAHGFSLGPGQWSRQIAGVQQGQGTRHAVPVLEWFW